MFTCVIKKGVQISCLVLYLHPCPTLSKKCNITNPHLSRKLQECCISKVYWQTLVDQLIYITHFIILLPCSKKWNYSTSFYKEGFAKRSIGGRRSGMLESNLNRLGTAYCKLTTMILEISIHLNC